jgi:mannan endo-1,4-beta-mannosidase
MSDSDHTLYSRVGTGLLAAAAALTIGVIVYSFVNPVAKFDPVAEGFVYAEGDQLMLEGEPFRYAGSNAYTLMLESQSGVELIMKTFVEQEFTVARAWAFFDTGAPDGTKGVEIDSRGISFQYWDEELGRPVVNEGPNGLERLDYMIYSAGQNGIKLVLPLVNNWTAFGGMDQYVRWADGDYHDDFLRDETIKGWYQDWVSHVVNRVNPLTGIAYKDDPTIMAWELGNEMRCSESGPYPSSPDCSSEIFVEWAEEMADFLKEQDPHHLIGFGGEGFLCSDPSSPSTLLNCEESADPVALLALENIDIHGIHVYPNHWLPTDPVAADEDWEDWAADWIIEHGKIAANAGKPYYLGEYGWIDQYERLLVFDHWLEAFYDAGGDGSHLWIMQPAASIAPPTDSVGFTQQCPGPACNLITNWSLHVRDGVDWNSFPPISETSFGASQNGASVTLDVLANDKAFGDATLDPATIDLDPSTAGIQTVFDSGKGVFEVVDGVVEYTFGGEGSGSARIYYSVSDSEGRTSAEARIAVARSTD